MLVAVERAVLGLPNDYRVTVRSFYVMRESPGYICRLVNMRTPKVRRAEKRGEGISRARAFVVWMFTTRAMVLNQLRLQGIVLSSALTSPPDRAGSRA